MQPSQDGVPQHENSTEKNEAQEQEVHDEDDVGKRPAESREINGV